MKTLFRLVFRRRAGREIVTSAEEIVARATWERELLNEAEAALIRGGLQAVYRMAREKGQDSWD